MMNSIRINPSEEEKSTTELYTISSNRMQGCDNFGHSIPELLTVTHETSPKTVNNQLLQRLPTSPQLITIHTNEMTPMPNGRRLGRRASVGIDFILLVVVSLWLTFIELGIFPHVKRGFYCDDRSITYKFNGDTISTVLICTSVFYPFILLWATEAILFQSNSLKSTRLKQTLFATLYLFKNYMIGMILKLFVVDALKVLVGELRPHFLDTCKPAVNCTEREYVTEWECTNDVDSIYFVKDSSKSFPSGHSSIAFYEAVFLIWYLQCRIPRIKSELLVPALQCFLLLWAILCSVSRITDNRHHWWDVLAGAKLGILFAALTCVFLCRNFRRKKQNDSILQNGDAACNGDKHTSVRRLLSDNSSRDENTVNNVVIT